MNNVGSSIVWSWLILLNGLPQHYSINSLLIVTKLSRTTLMLHLHRLTYIKSYRGFLFQLPNGQQKRSRDLSYSNSRWLNEICFNSYYKSHIYIYSSPCLVSRNRGYWLSYMYFIVLGGESVSTNTIGHYDGVPLRPFKLWSHSITNLSQMRHWSRTVPGSQAEW